ncbi:LacI family DNA-binding transcriptional regulator [Kribbella solani]|uniref:LacI family DNA-binding transcriptional regulator n=1 Tax=Kribbella solani TaxID=236067 RepID=UPI0029B60071|nr:LacI family DNA-binding transcriptional regulator [Kribbella solani]MDX2972105.1 LacI family DNA-binding transcriptional regulator [Kribbella solani]MDX3001811.1 LacI family DNA-binding transcriptional regulator [Kribbella solani]
MSSPGQPQRRATLKLVAESLGVSITTVSNAFSRPDQLSEALRERVLAEAARLGLSSPDAAARSLRLGRPASVGVMYTDRLSFAFSDPGAVLFLQGVSRVCEENGQELVLIPSTSAADAAATAVGRSMIDGLIVYSVADDDPVLAAAADRRMPLVVVDQPRISTLPWIGVDDEAGCRAIAQHLIGLGHRRLAVLSTEIDRERRGGRVTVARQQAITFATTAARLRGYRTAAEDAGINWSTVPVVETRENSEANGYQATAALLRSKQRPTAVLAMTDQLAFGALRAAAKAGLSVPEDLSVAGFDDIPAARVEPYLTTVAQPHEEKGRRAAEHLLAQLTDRSAPPRQQQLKTTLRLRETTGVIACGRR